MAKDISFHFEDNVFVYGYYPRKVLSDLSCWIAGINPRFFKAAEHIGSGADDRIRRDLDAIVDPAVHANEGAGTNPAIPKHTMNRDMAMILQDSTMGKHCGILDDTVFPHGHACIDDSERHNDSSFSYICVGGYIRQGRDNNRQYDVVIFYIFIRPYPGSSA